MIRIITLGLLIQIVFSGCEKTKREVEIQQPQQQYQAGEIGLLKDTLWDPPVQSVHIDPGNTGDPLKNGSLEHPYGSFQDIKWKDNTIYALKRGTTIETSAIMIFANNIIVASYGTGDRPVIKNTDAPSVSDEENYAISTAWNGGDRITLRDLEIFAPNSRSCILFRENSTNGKVLNCKLHGSTWGFRALGVTGLYVYNTEIFDTRDDGMFLKYSYNIEVSHAYIHHVNQNWVPPSTPETIASGDGIQMDSCNHWLVHHTHIDRSDTGNKFCFTSRNPQQDDGILEYNKLIGPLQNGFSIYFDNGKEITIRYNLIFGPSLSPVYSHADKTNIYYNIFKDISGPLYTDHSALVFNNLFYNMPVGIQGNSIVAENNIFDLGSADRVNFEVSDLTENHNLFVYGSPTQGSIVGNPRYVDAANGDFHLLPGSDCIGKGVWVGITSDLDAYKLTSTIPPDIGPYQFK